MNRAHYGLKAIGIYPSTTSLSSQQISMVKKEMAWEEEKHKIALDKLKSRFKDVVECERIVVKAFNTQHEVCSFRAAKLSDDFYATKADMERRKTTMMSKDEANRQASQGLINGSSFTTCPL